MADQEKLVLASAAFVVLSLVQKKKREKRKKRFWQATIFKNRHIYSGSSLLRDLKVEHDYGMFQNFCRMSPEDFKTLLKLVELKIMKSDTNYRRAIPAAERLALTLRFLATGDSYSSLMYVFKISKQAISKIIPEVCEAIIQVLHEHIKVSRH